MAFCGMAISNAQAIDAYTIEYDRNKVTTSEWWPGGIAIVFIICH